MNREMGEGDTDEGGVKLGVFETFHNFFHFMNRYLTNFQCNRLSNTNTFAKIRGLELDKKVKFHRR